MMFCIKVSQLMMTRVYKPMLGGLRQSIKELNKGILALWIIIIGKIMTKGNQWLIMIVIKSRTVIYIVHTWISSVMPQLHRYKHVEIAEMSTWVKINANKIWNISLKMVRNFKNYLALTWRSAKVSTLTTIMLFHYQ